MQNRRTFPFAAPIFRRISHQKNSVFRLIYADPLFHFVQSVQFTPIYKQNVRPPPRNCTKYARMIAENRHRPICKKCADGKLTLSFYLCPRNKDIYPPRRTKPPFTFSRLHWIDSRDTIIMDRIGFAAIVRRRTAAFHGKICFFFLFIGWKQSPQGGFL